jgi:hypothetical protein
MRLQSRIRFAGTHASTNPHLLKLGDITTDAVNEHLGTDYGKNQTHQSRNDLDAVVADEFDEAFSRGEKHTAYDTM